MCNWFKRIPDGVKRFLYGSVFYAATYLLLGLIIGFTLVTVIAACASYVIGTADWDWRQRRKAAKPEATDVS